MTTRADRMSIVMACDEGYAMPLATALRSLAIANERHWPLDVYVISDGFTEPVKERVRHSLPQGSVRFHWIMMGLQRFSGFSTMSHVSQMTFARLLLPELLPHSMQRVLYLDADLLVLGDLAGLWSMDLQGKSIGAVPDVVDPLIKSDHPAAAGLPRVRSYFNAGVLLIDLEAWREKEIGEQAIQYLTRHPKTPYSDQDALNAVLDDDWLEVAPHWNYQGHVRNRIEDLPECPAIVHFITRAKPWKREYHTANQDLFDQYRSQTLFPRATWDKAVDASKTSKVMLRRGAKWVLGKGPERHPNGAVTQPLDTSQSSKVEVLRSTTIVGGASAASLVVRIIRTKVLALLLGPTGIGLESLYDSVLSVLRIVFDMGTSTSGVRQIADAVSTGNPRRIATTVFTLRRTCAILGLLAAITLFLGRETASRAAFGDSTHSGAFGWLSIALFVGILVGGQSAMLQGMRRIGDLAWMRIIGAVVGAIASIPIVYIWGRAGIPAYMIISASMGFLIAWYFARQTKIEAVRLSAREVAGEARNLMTLGVAVMLSAVVASLGALLVRTLVVRQYGLQGAGEFQAAGTLSMVYVGFLLQAMGTDFYPRLTAVANDHDKFNRLVKEQASVSLVMAFPGVLATIALAPWVLQVFYSTGFSGATELLVWQMGGVLLKVISWPMGFMNFAKSKGAVIIGIDVATNAIYLGMSLLLLPWIGVAGAGIAFLGMTLAHLLITYAVARGLSGFRWGGDLLARGGLCVGIVLLVIWMRLAWPEPWATLIPCLLAVLASVYSLRNMLHIIGIDRARDFLGRLRLAWMLNLF